MRFWNVKIYVTDISNNAGTNPITINSSGFDTINRQGFGSFTIDYNGGDAVLMVVTGDKWVAFSQTYVSAYDLIQDEGISLPKRNTLDFQGLGVGVSDVGGKTVVTIPNVLPTGNYGLYTQASQGATITNTTTETTLIGAGIGGLTVPANSFSAGDSFHAIMTGHLSCANNQGFEIRIKSNTILLADTGLISLNTATNKHFKLEVFFTVRTTGISGIASIVSGGTFMYTKNASTSFEGSNFSTETFVGFDTTIPNTLDITAQWSNANPNNSIYSELFTLNKTF
jgi:hypothetical protein